MNRRRGSRDTLDRSSALFIGDDLTDESVFHALAGSGTGVVVAETDRLTAAELRLRSDRRSQQDEMVRARRAYGRRWDRSVHGDGARRPAGWPAAKSWAGSGRPAASPDPTSTGRSA